MNTIDIEYIGNEPIEIGQGFKACKFHGENCFKLIKRNGEASHLMSFDELKDFIRFLNNPTDVEKFFQEMLRKVENKE